MAAINLHILAEVQAERNRQDAKHGGPAHDDTHSPEDWCTIIDYLMEEEPKTGAEQRFLFIQIAATALAAIESHDRLFARVARGGSGLAMPPK